MMKKGDGIPTDMEKDKKQQKKTSPELVKEASSPILLELTYMSVVSGTPGARLNPGGMRGASSVLLNSMPT
jgi:hypothetical protein